MLTNGVAEQLLDRLEELLAFIFGGWETIIYILIGFVILDFISGLIKAIKQKKLNSDIGARGLLKKGSIFIVLILGILLDSLLNHDTYIVRDLVCYFYIVNEGISILENLSEIGVPIPKKLKEILDKLDSDRN